MRWVWGAVGLPLIWLAGCAPMAQERVRDYNDDGLVLFRHGSYDLCITPTRYYGGNAIEGDRAVALDCAEAAPDDSNRCTQRA